MGKVIHWDVAQHSIQWHQLRCGRLTASEAGDIITKAKLEPADNDTVRSLARKIAAERIKGIWEEGGQSFAMQQGTDMEPSARWFFEQHYEPVKEAGFIENDSFGFMFGASPDGLFLDGKGGLEIKCPQANQHLKTLLEGEILWGYVTQMQAIMLAGELEYQTFFSYHEGMAVKPIRVERDEKITTAIINAGKLFEQRVGEIVYMHSEIIRKGDAVPTVMID